MRARMALVESDIEFDIYEISLRNKPNEMLKISAKGTVPILRLNKLVLDESLDIIKWAYSNSKSNHCKTLESAHKKIIDELITINDGKFKDSLDSYKYCERYPEKIKVEHRKSCLFFLDILEGRLDKSLYLLSEKVSFADIAIMPFIRQFANVDMNYFLSLPHCKVHKWLFQLTNSDLFIKAMIKPG